MFKGNKVMSIKGEFNMRLFTIRTVSESGDHYTYLIKHHKKPSAQELKAFLVQYSTDTEGYTLYESVEEVEEIYSVGAKEIPKIPKKDLDKWSYV
jgi:hypothetical protein